MWDGSWRRERREEILWEIADFFAHLRAGAVEVQGDLPGGEVHPWDCFLDNDYSYIYLRCPGFTFHARGEVPKSTIETALAELRSRARAAGTVVRRVVFATRPAPPGAVRMARDIVHMICAKLGDLNLAASASGEDAHVLANAAALAAIEVGNWVAEVELHTDVPRDISYDDLKIWVYGGRADVDVGGKAIIWISAARAPRALRPAFATAYAKWYGRLTSALLTRRLEAIGV